MLPFRFVSNRREVAAAVLVLALGSSVACRGLQAGETGAPAPATGGVGGLATPRGSLPDAPAGTQEIAVQIVDGRFPAIRFNVRPGAVRLNLSARGGPYTLRIDPLLPAQRIPPDTTTLVAFTATTPGEYIMELTGPQKTETAILDVRPAP